MKSLGARKQGDEKQIWERLEGLYQWRFKNVPHEKRQAVWSVLADWFHGQMGGPEALLVPAAGYCEFAHAVPAKEVWAVDINDYGKRDCPQSKMHFCLGDIMTVPLPPQHFDGIFISNFLEHLSTTDELMKFLGRMHGLLKPDGVIGILGPNFKYAYREYYDFADHFLPLTHLSLEEYLTVSGFVVKKTIPRLLPYTFKSRLPASKLLAKIYLQLPIVWPLLGKQFFLVAQKNSVDYLRVAHCR